MEPNRAHAAERPIGIFDSGVGGITVLHELLRECPGEDLLYFGDSRNAPYGTRPKEEVVALATAAAEHLLAQNAKALVVACNTATGAAIAQLRARWPALPIIGIEPALKPAVLRTRERGLTRPRVLVMATPLTLQQSKFRALYDRFAADAEILLCPCPGLAERIERGQPESRDTAALLEALLAPWKDAPPDAVVLGCTHYPLVAKQIRAALGSAMPLYYGGIGTARQTRRRLEEAGLLRTNHTGTLQLLNSDPTMLPTMERMLAFCREHDLQLS
jgi:glutamate racemase